MSVSVGVAVADEPDEPIDELIETADQALYRAKRAGATGSSPPDRRYHRGVTDPTRPGRCRPDHPVTTQPDGDDAPRDLTNGDLARIFHEIGDMLEIKGELVFKTVAYHRAADAIGRSPVDLVSAYRAGERPQIPGVGKAISDKIEELATTGHMAYYDRLRGRGPAQPGRAAADPGARPEDGPAAHAELGIDHLDDLRAAAERVACASSRACRPDRGSSSSRASPGSTTDRPDAARPGAEDRIDGVMSAVAETPGVRSIEPAGSFRRGARSIGDLDMLAETDGRRRR